MLPTLIFFFLIFSSETMLVLPAQGSIRELFSVPKNHILVGFAEIRGKKLHGCSVHPNVV